MYKIHSECLADNIDMVLGTTLLSGGAVLFNILTYNSRLLFNFHFYGLTSANFFYNFNHKSKINVIYHLFIILRACPLKDWGHWVRGGVRSIQVSRGWNNIQHALMFFYTVCSKCTVNICSHSEPSAFCCQNLCISTSGKVWMKEIYYLWCNTVFEMWNHAL